VTRLLFRDDPYLVEFDAKVVSRTEHEGRPAVILDQTAFYAESGGQPFDTGTLGDVPVLAVLEKRGEVLHILASPLAPSDVHGRVDGERRRHFREQHHGQHLLSRAFLEVSGARTTSVHMGLETCSIDLDRFVPEAEILAAEARTNDVIWEARPVRVRGVSRSEAEALGIHAAEAAGDEIRLVEAQGFDLQPCGGTHPSRTSEVGVLLVLGSERYKGGARVRFVCGHRALEISRKRGVVLDRLTSLFSAPLAELETAASRTVEDLAVLTRRSQELLDRALEGEARRLLSASQGSPALVVSIYEGWEPADLRILALKVVGLTPAVALLASRGEKAHLVFAQSEGLPHDVPGLLRRAAARLGGRGGGKGNIAQGGGEQAGLDEALAAAALEIQTA
jgi:alanyl-tRNA synthetase